MEIEMVGWLIQQQQVRLHKQGSGQRYTHPPPPREGLGGALHHGRIKRQP
jgi:hypothetical protein